MFLLRTQRSNKNTLAPAVERRRQTICESTHKSYVALQFTRLASNIRGDYSYVQSNLDRLFEVLTVLAIVFNSRAAIGQYITCTRSTFADALPCDSALKCARLTMRHCSLVLQAGEACITSFLIPSELLLGSNAIFRSNSSDQPVRSHIMRALPVALNPDETQVDEQQLHAAAREIFEHLLEGNSHLSMWSDFDALADLNLSVTERESCGLEALQDMEPGITTDRPGPISLYSNQPNGEEVSMQYQSSCPEPGKKTHDVTDLIKKLERVSSPSIPEQEEVIVVSSGTKNSNGNSEILAQNQSASNHVVRITECLSYFKVQLDQNLSQANAIVKRAIMAKQFNAASAMCDLAMRQQRLERRVSELLNSFAQLVNVAVPQAGSDISSGLYGHGVLVAFVQDSLQQLLEETANKALHHFEQREFADAKAMCLQGEFLRTFEIDCAEVLKSVDIEFRCIANSSGNQLMRVPGA